VLCPLCHQRKARRACPALGQQICSVCCGTKRLTEINCPATCVYLATAREHPAAAVVRRQQQDFGWIVGHMRDLSERQSQLFFVLNSFLAGYDAGDLEKPIDEDVAEAAAALAGTLETAARGLIYEHRATSLAAQRLVEALKPLLNEVGKNGGTAFERDAAVVLRRIEQAARDTTIHADGNRRAYLDLQRRIGKRSPGSDEPAAAATPEPSRLILP
jgi:hypothetical protein